MPYASNDGVRIHYHTEGEGSPLVIQHGLTDSMTTWYELGYVDMLKDSHRLILIDARGHGASDKPHTPDAYRFETMAADVVTVLDDLNITRSHFMGYSMGGLVGFAIAKYAAERFHSLILGGYVPYDIGPEFDDRRIEELKGDTEVLLSWLEASDVQLSQSARARLLANDADALAASLVQLRDAPSMEDVLPNMKMPCLLIVGEDDAVYPFAVERVKQMPNATLVSLPGLDHVTTMFRSDLVVPHVRSFLAEVDSLVNQ